MQRLLLLAPPAGAAPPPLPPFLLAVGNNDTQVPYSQTLRLHAALQAAGAASELTVIPHAGHKSQPVALWRPVVKALSARYLDLLFEAAR